MSPIEEYMATVQCGEDAARKRLAALRVEAARRSRTMPSYPDPADEVAERDEERPGWLALQARSFREIDGPPR